MFNDFDKEMVGKHFNGDGDAYLKDVAKGRRKRMKWGDIIASANLFPELEMSAIQVVKFMLGYVPEEYLILPQTIFLRSLADQLRNKTITIHQLWDEAEIHVRMIRNAEMIGHDNLNYDRAYYQTYFEYLPEYAERAKERLTNILGYEPKLEHSLYGEIVLRQEMASDQAYFMESVNTMDLRAIVQTKYREILLTKGRKAADASPLPAIDILTQNNGGIKTNWKDFI